MTSDKPPVTIKKYANRRLYNTGTSTYVTLEDLAAMVKRGDDFVVYDAKGGEDITRSVLAQIIFEQEGKSGQSLLPITFLRQLIRFYGDSMQMLVPSYLEFSLDKLVKEKSGFADIFGHGASALGALSQGAFTNSALTGAARPIFAQLEEQTKQNVALFRQALSMFNPMVASPSAPDQSAGAATPQPSEQPPQEQPFQEQPPVPRAKSDYDEMREQIEALQRRIESLAPKD